MKILRVIAAGVAFLFLVSCAGLSNETPATTEITTTQAETTTQIPPLELTYGEFNDIAWRELDLTNEANAELLAWLEGQLRSIEMFDEPEFELSATKTLFERRREIPSEGYHIGTLNDIWLRNEVTGKETVLIEGSWDGEDWWHTHQNPFVREIIDERFFLYGLIFLNGHSVGGVFDIERMLQIPIEFPRYTRLGVFTEELDGTHYLFNGGCGHDCGCGQAYVYTFTLENLATATSLQISENLLAGITESYFESCIGQTLVSPDGRYFVVSDSMHTDALPMGVHIFDLHEQVFVAHLPIEHVGRREFETFVNQSFNVMFRDNNTVIVYHSQSGPDDVHIFEPLALKITLP